MSKSMAYLTILVFMGVTAMGCAKDEDDKEGLRKFLRQSSVENINGSINAEQLGLKIKDTINWQNSGKWVRKIECLVWNSELPNGGN